MAVLQGTGVGAIKQAIFRADASPEIGSGHVMRCLALAEALEATGGWRCGLATRPETGAMVPSIRNLRCDHVEIDGDEPAALAGGWPSGCDLLVVDHYRRDADFEIACRPWARRIMVIDDLADRPHECDLLLDQTAGRETSDYGAIAPASCRMMMGSSYALLRPEFLAARASALESRARPVRRILVALGASDPGDATSLVLDGIALSGVEASIDVVLGKDTPHLANVRDRIASMPHETVLRRAASNMAELMSSADMAIGAAGTTSWERCCLGLPTLIVITADNQRLVSAALNKAGAARLLGRPVELTAAKIGDAVARIANDHDARQTMAEKAAALCDGRGLDRVVLAIAAPSSQWLRLATPDDGPLMFDWQCHPATRRFARNRLAPTRDEHDRWMDRTCSDADVMLMLVMEGDEPVGVLRLDAIDGPMAREVSIYVAPERHGQGIGAAALKLAHSIYPSWTFHAEALAENRASHALFRSAGYRKLSKTRYVLDSLARALN